MLKPLFLISITGAVLAATAIVACGGTSTCTGDACGTGGSTGSTTSTTSTTAGTGGATTTTTGTGGAGGQGGATTTTTTTTTTTGTGGGSGSSCGGKMGKTCPVGEYCDYPDNICGAADGTGICTAKPQVCPDLYMPTCACDGMVYSSPCDAAGAGFDENNNAGCAPPAGLFPCGSKFCDVKTQYCQRSLTDVGGTSDTYACVSLPAGCGNAPSCACLTNEPCGPACASSGDGLILTCPGG